MDGQIVLIGTLIGGAIGGIYGLIVHFWNKSKQKGHNDNQDVSSKPKRSNLIPLLGIVVIAVSTFAVISLIYGPTQGAPKEKTFSKSGLTITLTNKFYEKEFAPYAAAYSSDSIAVFTLKEDKSLFGNEDLTLLEYAELVVENNQLNATVREIEGLISFTFEKTVDGKDYTYFATVYKSNDSYWLLQISCENTKYEDLKSTIVKYTKSVKV